MSKLDKQLPLLSVLISYYNAGKTITRALMSLKGLTIPYEVCLYDDGSMPLHQAHLIGLEMVSDKIVFGRGEKNLGHIGKTRNQTLKLAKGKYVVVLDSDDSIVPQGIEAQIQFLEENPDYGWGHAPAFIMKPSGEWGGVYLLSIPKKCAADVRSWSHNSRMELEQKLYFSVPEGIELLKENLSYSFINNWGCVMNRAIVNAVGGWSEDLPGNGCGEDYDMNLKMSFNSKAKWIRTISYAFTQDQDASRLKWDYFGGKDLGPFSNYPFIQAKWEKKAGFHTDREWQEKAESLEKQQSPKVLDIGCGPFRIQRPGYLVDRCDSRKETGANLVCDAAKLPVVNGAYDMVHASHVLEHFPRWQGPAVLREWVRVLKMNGTIEIKVPDIKTLAANIFGNAPNHHDLHCQLFGAHTNAYDEHHAFYTEDSLSQIMWALGVRKTYCVRDLLNGPNLTWKGRKEREVTPKDVMWWYQGMKYVSSVGSKAKKIPVEVCWSDEVNYSEMTIVFEDAMKKHHFRWSCVISGGYYTASLQVTEDVASVTGGWTITVWCDGVKVDQVRFVMNPKDCDHLFEESEGYLGEESCVL